MAQWLAAPVSNKETREWSLLLPLNFIFLLINKCAIMCRPVTISTSARNPSISLNVKYSSRCTVYTFRRMTHHTYESVRFAKGPYCPLYVQWGGCTESVLKIKYGCMFLENKRQCSVGFITRDHYGETLCVGNQVLGCYFDVEEGKSWISSWAIRTLSSIWIPPCLLNMTHLWWLIDLVVIM